MCSDVKENCLNILNCTLIHLFKLFQLKPFQTTFMAEEDREKYRRRGKKLSLLRYVISHRLLLLSLLGDRLRKCLELINSVSGFERWERSEQVLLTNEFQEKVQDSHLRKLLDYLERDPVKTNSFLSIWWLLPNMVIVHFRANFISLDMNIFWSTKQGNVSHGFPMRNGKIQNDKPQLLSYGPYQQCNGPDQALLKMLYFKLIGRCISGTSGW